LTLLPDWKLVICGAGNDESRMRRLAQRLGVDGRVEWLGWLAQEQVVRQMARADVFLFPSIREEAGAVIAEARAAGLPVVCLARGGPPLIAGPAGTSVSVSGGVRAISQRLANASSMAVERRRGGEAEASNVEDLSLENRAEALRELLTKTLQLDPDDPRGRRWR